MYGLFLITGKLPDLEFACVSCSPPIDMPGALIGDIRPDAIKIGARGRADGFADRRRYLLEGNQNRAGDRSKDRPGTPLPDKRARGGR